LTWWGGKAIVSCSFWCDEVEFPPCCVVSFRPDKEESQSLLVMSCPAISMWQGDSPLSCWSCCVHFDVTRSRHVLPFWCDEGIPPLVVLSCPFLCDDEGISPHHVTSFSTWWGGVLSLTQWEHSYNKEGPLIVVSLFTLLIHLHIVIRIRFCIQ